MALRILMSDLGPELDAGEDGCVDFCLNKNGSLDIYVDNGKNGYDSATARFSAEDAPDALLAIQTWIESLTKEA